MDLSQKKMLIGMLLTGTVMGGAGVVGMNVLPPALFPLPEGAEVINPLSGEVTVAAASAEDDEALEPANTGSERVTRVGKRTLIDPIIRRSMFDNSRSVQRPHPKMTERPVRRHPAAGPAGHHRGGAGGVRSCLIAEEKSEDGAAGYGIGDTVMDDATVHRIEQKRVVLKRSDGELEYLAMDDAGSSARRQQRRKRPVSLESGTGSRRKVRQSSPSTKRPSTRFSRTRTSSPTKSEQFLRRKTVKSSATAFQASSAAPCSGSWASKMAT